MRTLHRISLSLPQQSINSSPFIGKFSEEEEGDDDDCYDDNEEKEPSWEKQEAMVRRLQRKFPDQDKEVQTYRHFVAICDTFIQFVFI